MTPTDFPAIARLVLDLFEQQQCESNPQWGGRVGGTDDWLIFSFAYSAYRWKDHWQFNNDVPLGTLGGTECPYQLRLNDQEIYFLDRRPPFPGCGRIEECWRVRQLVSPLLHSERLDNVIVSPFHPSGLTRAGHLSQIDTSLAVCLHHFLKFIS